MVAVRIRFMTLTSLSLAAGHAAPNRTARDAACPCYRARVGGQGQRTGRPRLTPSCKWQGSQRCLRTLARSGVVIVVRTNPQHGLGNTLRDSEVLEVDIDCSLGQMLADDSAFDSFREIPERHDQDH